MSDYLIKVKDKNSLVRDVTSNGIVNIDTDAYQNYVDNYRRVYNESQKIKNLEDDLNSIKDDINEIKNLLRNLKNGSWQNISWKL